MVCARVVCPASIRRCLLRSARQSLQARRSAVQRTSPCGRRCGTGPWGGGCPLRGSARPSPHHRRRSLCTSCPHWCPSRPVHHPLSEAGSRSLTLSDPSPSRRRRRRHRHRRRRQRRLRSRRRRLRRPPRVPPARHSRRVVPRLAVHHPQRRPHRQPVRRRLDRHVDGSSGGCVLGAQACRACALCVECVTMTHPSAALPLLAVGSDGVVSMNYK